MRNSANILIYIDVQKALDAGIRFFLSSNGVVLTEGDDSGVLRSEFFQRVTDKKGNELTGWRNEQSGDATTTALPASATQVDESTLPMQSSQEPVSSAPGAISDV